MRDQLRQMPQRADDLVFDPIDRKLADAVNIQPQKRIRGFEDTSALQPTSNLTNRIRLLTAFASCQVDTQLLRAYCTQVK